MNNNVVKCTAAGIALVLLLTGCSTPVARGTAEPPETNRFALPIKSSDGIYVSPLKSDGTLAAWAEEGIRTFKWNRDGESPFAFRGFLMPTLANQLVAKQIQSDVPDKLGGWQHIRATSDQSFNNIKDFRAYILSYRGSDIFGPAWGAAVALYPEVKACGFHPIC
jgi:hypothetical protein